MNFKELLDRYKDGTLTDEEKKLIEDEIEKFEAIEEYLAENMELGFKLLNDDEKLDEETIEIKKSISNRLRRVVITSVATILAIILCIFYIVSPIVDSFYYNPTDKSVSGKYNNDIFYDLKAINELNQPSRIITIELYSEKLGFGRYNVNYKLKDTFTQQEIPISYKIERNKLKYAEIDLSLDADYHYAGFMTVSEPDSFISRDHEEQKKRVMDHLKKLNPASYVSAYITFDEDLTMKELWELKKDYNENNPTEVNIVWVAIRTSPEGEKAEYITGFKTNPNSGVITSYVPDREKYPLFQLGDLYNRDNYSNKIIRSESLFPTAYETHYKTLLKYLIDREEAVKTLESEKKYEYYHSALNFVEENGVKTFGILVYADAEDLIEFVENNPVKTLVIYKALASKPYVNW